MDTNLLNDETNVFEVTELNLDSKGFKNFISFLFKSYEWSTDLMSSFVYVIVNNLRKNPDYIETLFEQFNQVNASTSTNRNYIRIICIAVFVAVKQNIIAQQKAIEFFDILSTYNNNNYNSNDDIIVKTIQRFIFDLKVDLPYRIKCYGLILQNNRYARALLDIRTMKHIMDDYAIVSENDKTILSKILLPEICDKNSTEKFLYCIKHDSYLEVLYNILKKSVTHKLFYWNYANVSSFVGLLPPDRFKILLQKIKNSDNLDFLKEEDHIIFKFLGFLIDNNNFHIKHKYISEMDDLSPLIPCLDKDLYWKVYNCINSFAYKSSYTAVLLNNIVITDDSEKFLQLLKIYLASSYERRKLDSPVIPVSAEIIKKLSNKNFIALILRSFDSNGAIRFSYDDDALNTINIRASSLLFTKELSADDFSKFISSHKKIKEE